MPKTIKPKRDASNPKWVRNAEITESIRLIQNQWCRDNGYAIRGKYRQKSGRNVSKKRQPVSHV